MNLSSVTQARGAKIGNLYGWAIGFLPFGQPGEPASRIFTSNDYHAKITATLPDGLSGGAVSIVIDAVTDDHYRAIRACTAADLYLFWQDVNAGFLGYLGGISGLSALGGGPSAVDLAPALVMRFAFQTRRQSGARGYETVLEGRDNAFHRLSRTPAPRACFGSLADALAAIGQAAGVTITPEPSATTLLGQILQPEDEQTDAAGQGQTCAGALGTIGARISSGSRVSPEIPALRRDAPSVILLRDGDVHVGRRGLPFPTGSAPQTLDASNGLVEVSREGEGDEGVAERWTLLCRGRSDLKPSDIVQFKKPDADMATTPGGAALALAGTLAGPIMSAVPESPDCSILVTGISHSMSRTGGFSTSVTGRTIPQTMPTLPWSLFATTGGLEEGPVSPIGRQGGDPATAIGRQVRDLARAALGSIRQIEVAEVRSAITSAGSPPEPPAQTVTVWEGTGGRTAQAHASRRLPIRRTDPYERSGAATVTPFAWGACGLAVPRYPGMRVALGFANGQSSDPLDLGALWGPEARMESQPGDWWLKLPVDQNTGPITDTADHLPSGQVVNDLTDKAGVRVIEVGKLTVRVGNPPKINDRPKHTASEAISIEHADGKASIRMDQDGKITITGKSIAIDAGTGTISLTAKDVNVSVSHQMKVE